MSTDETLTLDIPHELVERIAVRVAELLSEQGPADSDPLLSAQEAASRVGVHVETIRRAIREGRLEASKAGSAIRIAPDDLSRWITAPEARVTAPRRRRGRTGNALADGLAANNC